MEMKKTVMNEDLAFAKANNDAGDRFLHLTPTAKEILTKVKDINHRMGYKDHDYIFCRQDGRTTRREIAYCIEKACNKAGMPVKTAHDIRSTVASTLIINQVPLNEIRCFLGHSNESTTLSYIFNPFSKETTNQLIDNALMT